MGYATVVAGSDYAAGYTVYGDVLTGGAAGVVSVYYVMVCVVVVGVGGTPVTAPAELTSDTSDWY